MIAEFYGPFEKELEKADAALPKIDLKKEVERVGRACPDCGHDLLYRDGRYGRFIGCSNFPKCRYTEQILNKIGVPCPQDGGDLVEKRTKRGRVFTAAPTTRNVTGPVGNGRCPNRPVLAVAACWCK
ncbi:MAG: topoisomerase DNA-binding C4 zinc finger domain-containing protein [Chloroflexi bacterium]|nr:topoisomerase DNA-binding C4 zinc finger domain-containing protein [Chloroflexota bacterium]